MNQFAAKFKLVFIPFLIIAVATVCAYTLLHWILFVKTGFFTVDEEILKLWAPMIFPGIPILIWLRPRIKLLNLKNKNGKGDPLSGYIMCAWMATAVPTIIAQEYLVTATGKLTVLEYMSQINKLPKTKYYTVKHFYIDKKLVRVKPTFEVSGKYNEHFDMQIFAPCPIYDRNYSGDSLQTQRPIVPNPESHKALIVLNGRPITSDSLKKINPKIVKNVTVLKSRAAVALYGNNARFGAILVQTSEPPMVASLNKKADGNAELIPVAWVALKYQKTISNKLSTAEKEQKYKEFAGKSQVDFNSRVMENFVYLDKMAASSDLKNYTAAIRSKGSGVSNAPPIVLSPVNEAFEARTGKKLPWVFGSFGIGAAIFLITLLFKPLKDEADVIDEGTEKFEKFELLRVFVPRDGYYITPLIIDLNVLIWIMMVVAGLGFVSFNAAELLKYGANYRPLVISGQYWRLLTNVFLHGGVMHLLFNMYGLLFVGIFLEPIMGRNKFAAVYLVTGIAASLASMWWHANTISVGASGAIFGMYGVFLALLTTNLFPPGFKKSFLISTSFFVGYNLLFGLMGGIDNAAHIGGLISGLIIGYALFPTLRDQKNAADAETETNQFLEALNNKGQ